MKHTQGPWSSSFKEESNSPLPGKTWTLCASPKIKPTPILIAGIFDCIPSEADARIITLAPEMLALLKEMKARKYESPSQDGWDQRLDAIIAKAEGEGHE